MTRQSKFGEGDASNAPAQNAQSFTILREFSSLLNTGLDDEELLICIRLIESGANPTVLAHLVSQMRQHSTELAAAKRTTAFSRHNGDAPSYGSQTTRRDPI